MTDRIHNFRRGKPSPVFIIDESIQTKDGRTLKKTFLVYYYATLSPRGSSPKTPSAKKHPVHIKEQGVCFQHSNSGIIRP